MNAKAGPAVATFNGPIEIGLRALVVLHEAYPDSLSLERLVILDYLVVHSDDIPGGPVGLHPRTPHRSGELLVRRGVLLDGLHLYQGRDLVEERFQTDGVFYAASEQSGAFLEALDAEYVQGLRSRAAWLASEFAGVTDQDLQALVRENLGAWGAEFAMQSVLWAEETK